MVAIKKKGIRLLEEEQVQSSIVGLSNRSGRLVLPADQNIAVGPFKGNSWAYMG